MFTHVGFFLYLCYFHFQPGKTVGGYVSITLGPDPQISFVGLGAFHSFVLKNMVFHITSLELHNVRSKAVKKISKHT